MSKGAGSYREMLAHFLEKAIARNPAYSQRALARDIGLAPSLVSDILSGKRGISVARATEIVKLLGFDETDSEIFITFVRKETSEQPGDQERHQAKVEFLRARQGRTDTDLTAALGAGQWYQLPILELPMIDGFDVTAESVAQVLGISTEDAEDALERLIAAGLLAPNAEGFLKKTKPLILAKSEESNAALRAYHKAMMTKAIESLTGQTPQEKFVGSETFAFDESALAEANVVIEDCFAKLIQLSSVTKPKTALYHAGIQLFRLTAKD